MAAELVKRLFPVPLLVFSPAMMLLFVGQKTNKGVGGFLLCHFRQAQWPVISASSMIG